MSNRETGQDTHQGMYKNALTVDVTAGWPDLYLTQPTSPSHAGRTLKSFIAVKCRNTASCQISASRLSRSTLASPFISDTGGKYLAVARGMLSIRA